MDKQTNEHKKIIYSTTKHFTHTLQIDTHAHDMHIYIYIYIYI